MLFKPDIQPGVKPGIYYANFFFPAHSREPFFQSALSPFLFSPRIPLFFCVCVQRMPLRPDGAPPPDIVPPSTPAASFGHVITMLRACPEGMARPLLLIVRVTV